MSAELSELIHRSLWAVALSEPELEQLKSEIVERRFAAGAYVCRKGESVDHWHGIVNGLLKMSSVSSEGRTTSFTGLGKGGWFGEGSLLKREPRRYDVVALRETRVACMPRSTFERLLNTNIGFNRFLLTQFNERLAQFIGLMESERLLDPDARVARCISSMYNPVLYPGLTHHLHLSQEEIGYLSGISRQRVNQALQVLERNGFLRVEYGAVLIKDLDGLRAYGM